MNSHKKVSEYATEDAKALNLGVYLVDLGYAVKNYQCTAALNSVAAVAQLAKELNITSAFDKSTVDRVRANEGKQDSLISIVLGQFGKTHAQLESTGRKRTAHLIFAGGFTEGIYLIANLPKNNHKPEIKNLLGMQKLFPKDVLELVRSSNGGEQKPGYYRAGKAQYHL